MYVPVILLCLISEPESCALFRGPIVENEQQCEVSMVTQALPLLAQQNPDSYLAGFTCLDVTILDQAVEAQ